MSNLAKVAALLITVMTLSGCAAGIQTPLGGYNWNVLPGALPDPHNVPPPGPPNYLR